MPLKIKVETKGTGVYLVTLEGPLDATTHVSFEKQVEHILMPTTKMVILDMQEVDYISSLGLGAIFKIRQILIKQNGNLGVTNLQPQVKKVFEAVAAMPNGIFANLQEVDDYLTEIQRNYKEKNKPY